MFLYNRTMVSRTVTITVPVQTQTYRVPANKMRFNPDGDDPGNDNSPDKTPSDKVATVTSGKITRILAKFTVVNHRNMVRPEESVRKTAYRLLTVKEDITETFKEIFDPAERSIYLRLFVENDKIIWPRSRVPTSFYVVRKTDNSVGLVYPQEAKDARHAWLMFELSQSYRTATTAYKQKKNDGVQRRAHYHFEAAERHAMRLVEELGSCKNQNECQHVLKRACVEKTKHPEVLKAIYRYAVHNGSSSDMTWEEICYA